MVEGVKQLAVETGSEGDLIVAARSGSADAFDLLMQRYYAGVRLYLYRFVNDPDLADDLAQDVFFTVYQKLHKLSDDRIFVAWLFRIARNHAISYLRRQRLRQTVSLDHLLPRLAPHHGGSRPSDAETLYLHDVIQQAIDELSSTERDAMLLHSIAGFSTVEIAEALGISTAAAGRRISRGKDHFRRQYAALTHDDDSSKGTTKHHA